MLRFIVLLALCQLVPAGARAGGDVAKGLEISKRHCARCHVIGEYNPLGGIYSTPSFNSLARRADAVERLQTFYQRRPHPVFVRVPGVARWSDTPPYAKPFTVTPEQIEHVIAYVLTLKGKQRRWPRRRRR